MSEYDTIGGALYYLEEHSMGQSAKEPSLEELAKAAKMSPTAFQKAFTKWVGVSPKQFLQYLKLERAKEVIGGTKLPLHLAAYHAGLSGAGRLHDLFLTIERMTPGEYANGGAGLEISYSTGSSPFGQYLVASTDRGVCWLQFFDGDSKSAERIMRAQWPKARFIAKAVESHRQVARFFAKHLKKGERITLHLRGTPFQTKVWEALLHIEDGKFVAYSAVAKAAGNAKAVRAAASAVGDNPVCYLIPCHRVIRSTGAIGNYGGGKARKIALLGYEAAQSSA